MAISSAARFLLSSNIQDNNSGSITAADVRGVLSSTLDAVDEAENPVISVKKYGAVGDGIADDTAAIQAALDASDVIFVPSGTYRTTSTLTVTSRNGVRFLGASVNSTVIQRHGSAGNVMTFTGCAFCSVENLAFQHGSGTGTGLLFTGEGGSNNVYRCFFANNSANGLAFTGTALVTQSNNKIRNCLFLQNGAEQLLLSYCNDSTVDSCAMGNAAAPYSVAACKLSNSSAGRYTGNECWGNLNGLILESSHYVRMNANRFEESRREGVLATSCLFCVFSGNLLHTNSQSATGVYSAMKLSGCTSWTITGNQTLSWNTDLYKHKNGLELDSSCSAINIVGNSFYHNVGQPLALNSATDVFTSSNHPVSEGVRGSVLSVDINAGNGTVDAKAAILAAAETGQVYFPAGTYRVASNLTLSVPVKFDARAKLSIDAGAVVTLWGKLDGPDQQIFTGTGAVVGPTSNVRPEWWGALHDGTTDDATAINKAIACVGTTGGGTIQFSSGFYIINSPLIIAYDNVILKGLGRRLTHIRNATINQDSITVLTGKRYWAIQDMSIFHFLTTPDGVTKTTGGAGINAVSAQAGTIHHVDIWGAYRGIILGDSAGTQVSDFEIQAFPMDGIQFVGVANDVFVRDGQISGAFNGVAGTGNAGLRFLNKCETIFVSSLDILFCEYALHTTGTSASAGPNPSFNYFESCFFGSCRSGVNIHRGLSLHFTDCWFSNRPSSGCTVSDSIGTSFVNCTFINSDLHGCTVDATSKNTRFSNCMFDSNSQATTNTYDGISVAAGTTDFIITNCTFTNTGRFGGSKQRNGVRVNTGASDRYIIADNLVTGNVGAGVVDNGTGVNKRVENNY